MAKKDRSKSERFEVDETMSASEVAGYLEGLAKSLRDGTVVIGDEAEGFKAVVGGDVDFELEARSGKRKSRVELKLAFRTPRARADEPNEDQPAATIPDEMSF